MHGKRAMVGKMNCHFMASWVDHGVMEDVVNVVISIIHTCGVNYLLYAVR